MSGRRGPRRQVLDQLAQVGERLAWLKSRWTVKSTVWLFEGEREPGSNVRQRPRRPEEYPENDDVQWEALRVQAAAAARELQALSQYAAEQLAARQAADGD